MVVILGSPLSHHQVQEQSGKVDGTHHLVTWYDLVGTVHY